MAFLEKLSIYIPNEDRTRLMEDAKLFEVFKQGSSDVNFNRFLGNLLLGYYDYYYSESRDLTNLVTGILHTHMPSMLVDDVNLLSTEIINRIAIPEVNYSKNKRVKTSIKPTSKTESIIQDIMDANKSDSISNTFARLFRSYLEKPVFVREQIIYSETYEVLREAIAKKKTIAFSTTRKKDMIRIVFPYEIATGTEELFNYLLCAEYDSNGKLRARTFRLSRIEHIHKCHKTVDLNDTVKDYLERMKRYGPAYEINDSEECCVFLSEEGHRSYNFIYYQRPQYLRIEKHKDGYYYFFDCSKDHLVRYFRRFDPGQAVIQKPEWLKNMVFESYRELIKEYENSN